MPILAAGFPALTGHVVDAAQMFTPNERQEIEQVLSSDVENQIVLATVPSIQNMPVEEYANELFRYWGLGSQQKNNGVLILIAPNDRVARIEVGYGLEEVLTDALSSQIMQKHLISNMAKGNYKDAGLQTSMAIVSVLQGNIIEFSAPPKKKTLEQYIIMVFCTVFMIVPLVLGSFALPFLLFYLFIASKNGSQGGRGSSSRNYSSGGSFSSSSSSHSSSGGFSGGGGSSGGGGASGRW